MGWASRAVGIGFWVVAAAGLLAASPPAQAQWQIQSITAIPPNGQTGPFRAAPAITFDNLNRPHVAYRRIGSGYVIHAYGNTFGQPAIWTMPTTPYQLAFGTLGTLCLGTGGSSVYMSVSGTTGVGNMASAVFDGTSWSSYSPTGWPLSGMHCGMATDASGYVHWVADNVVGSGTTSYRGFVLLHQTDPTSVWTPLAPGFAVQTDSLSALGVLQMGGEALFDATGVLHTVQCYGPVESTFLLYAKGPASGPFVVDSNVDPGWAVKIGRPSIAVDSTNSPHIVYTTLWPSYCVNYVSQAADGTWQRETVDGGGNYSAFVGTFPKVLIDRRGIVHVIYTDGLHGQIKHARQGFSQWQIEVIDTVGTQANYGLQVGALTAGLDPLGGIGVAYWDAEDGMLKYAYLAP